MQKQFRGSLACVALLAALCNPVSAWDYAGHRLINELALTALPTNFPAFAREKAAVERIQFLSGEPDRWRNNRERGLRHAKNPDHYFDFEDLVPFGLAIADLNYFRYDFVAQMALARKQHPERFPADSKPDPDLILGMPGFLPWAINEQFGQLKSAFAYLKVFDELGTPEEIANARANVIYHMGVIGHFVGDASQPLHTTRHFNGWVGDNPEGYTTKGSFHAWIDGGFFKKAGGHDRDAMLKLIRPARLVDSKPVTEKVSGEFKSIVDYIHAQHRQVLPLYQLDKAGKLTGEIRGADKTGIAGKSFLEGQMLNATQFLADLWLTAWQQAPTDFFLRGQLIGRKPNK